MGDGKKAGPGLLDSWERLREDAKKGYEGYWGCDCEGCGDCPAEVGGENPMERFGVATCEHAARLDVLARAQRLAWARCDRGATEVRRSCDTCRWWEKFPDALIGACGTCRRCPQIAYKLPKDWCGEWVGR